LSLVLAVSPACSCKQATTTLLSPDDKIRVSVIEASSPGSIDRNFQIRLEVLDSGATSVVFTSPDEGLPVGSERFIWSKDGTAFLLVGRHFALRDSITLATGEEAYFLYNLSSNRAWCNSRQQSAFPHFTRDMLHGIQFTETIEWK